MVFDPPKETVNVKRIMIYSFIPILAIYAGWHIQKFWVLFGINLLIGYGIGIPVAIVIPWPFYFFVSWGIEIPISVLVVRHYARKYNEKVMADSSTKES